jgi:hypothetical protein
MVFPQLHFITTSTNRVCTLKQRDCTVRNHITADNPLLFFEAQSLLYVAHVSILQSLRFVYRVHSRKSNNILNKQRLLL